MFDIGWGELVVIGVVALIVIGPKELPTVLRTLGQYMGKIRRMAGEFQGQFQEALREAEMSDLRKQAEDIKSSFTDFAAYDPMAETPKAETQELNPPDARTAEPADTPAGEGTAAALPAPAEAAEPTPAIDIPLPETPAPVTEADFAPAQEPAAKKAGSGA